MNQPISSKHYKINGSPLHVKKNPVNSHYIPTRNPVQPDSFQASLNMQNGNHLLYPRKPPSFNLSKSQEVLPKNYKKPEFSSNAKILSRQANNGSDGLNLMKDSKGMQMQMNSLQSKKSPIIALKLPKIGTPEDQKNRLKANSLNGRVNNNTKKDKDNEKKENFESNGYNAKAIDIKKQKRLSDAGNIGFIISPDQMEELRKSQERQLTKPHANSYEKTNEKPGAFISHSEAKIITNFAFKTRAGALPGNVVKTNQDSYIVHTNFCQMREAAFYAVCDGHGVNGHLVSGFVKEVLPKNLEREYKSRNSDIKRTFLEAFDRTFKDLDSTSIDINFSGTTTVSLLLLNKSLYSANVGDSRAILISCNKQGEWSCQPLSRDQKPDDPMEMQRILKCGGRVEAFKDYNGDPVGPARVWLKHENIPGLAMARSIGDKVAAQVGVLAEPEVMEFQLTEEDKMIVLASDGVWEFLSNDQVMNYILPFYLKNQPELACEKVIKESVNWWKKEDEVIDDITIILIFLKV